MLAIPLTLVLIFLNPPVILFTMAAGYAISGPVVTFFRYRRARAGQDGDEGETGA